MTDLEILTINTEYRNRLECFDNAYLASGLRSLFEGVRNNRNYALYDALLDHEAGKRVRVSFPHTTYTEMYLGKRTSLQEMKETSVYAIEKEKKEICSLYLQAKERLNERTFFSKVFHPFRTYQENCMMEEIHHYMDEIGVTDKDVLEVKTVLTTSEEGKIFDLLGKESVSVSLDECNSERDTMDDSEMILVDDEFAKSLD